MHTVSTGPLLREDGPGPRLMLGCDLDCEYVPYSIKKNNYGQIEMESNIRLVMLTITIFYPGCTETLKASICSQHHPNSH